MTGHLIFFSVPVLNINLSVKSVVDFIKIILTCIVRF